MLYYKVKKEYDNKPIIEFYRGKQALTGYYIENELYTARELKKHLDGFSACEPVEIPKSKIYFFFGARFSTEE